MVTRHVRSLVSRVRSRFATRSTLPSYAAVMPVHTYTWTPRQNRLVKANPPPVKAVALEQAFLTASSRAHPRAFFVNDVRVVEHQYARWMAELPQVRPFYAVKCNPDAVLMQHLHKEGAGFDCASGEEMQQALALGVAADDIIFANPIKSTRDLQFARLHGVNKMTFDNEDELYKIQAHHPDAQLVLRLLADDSGSTMKFGCKFGAPEHQVARLFETARALELRVVGTSFHIGSGCFTPSAYAVAISLSRRVHDQAVRAGLPPLTLVDIGGGFPGNPVPNEATDNVPAFEAFAAEIHAALDRHFPREQGVSIIGEPGRFMASAWSTLFVMVQGKREVVDEVDANSARTRQFLYYLNDGIYGSFNNIMFDHAKPDMIPVHRFLPAQQVPLPRQHALLQPNNPTSGWSRAFHRQAERDTNCTGTFFGPTCDSIDKVAQGVHMEELFIGDWLAFPRSGAYTSAAATTFNGMPKADIFYCRSNAE